MPLIRIVGHHHRNDEGVDKLIVIEGLPDSIFYQTVSGWEYDETEIEDNGEPKRKFRAGVKGLKPPWEIDYPDNIPKEIRSKYGIDETVYEQVVEHVEGKRPEKVVVPRHVVGFKLDYQSSQGESTWKNIERILDRETPRDRQVPEPAVVGDRRNWKLELEDVPVVQLSALVLPVSREAEQPIAVVVASDDPAQPDLSLSCCNKQFKDRRALNMHNITRHKKASATAGV